MSRIRSVPLEDWPIRSRGSWRHVYVIQEGESGPVKVGIAANAFWRKNELQIGNFRRLTLVAVYSCDEKRHASDVEKWVHRQLEEHHLGGEWFAVAPTDVVNILMTRCI